MKKALLSVGSGLFLWFLILLSLDHWPTLQNAVAFIVASAITIGAGAWLVLLAFDWVEQDRQVKKGNWFWMTLVLGLASEFAHAQDTVALSPTVAAVAPEQLAEQVFDAVAIGDWWAAAALAITLITFGVLKWAKSEAAKAWPRLSAFLLRPLVSFLMPIVLAAVPGTVAAVMSGKPFTLGLLLGAIVKMGGGSKMLFLGIKNAMETPAPKVPPAAALLLLPLLLLSSGCTASQAFVVTGESIKATGRQYVETSEAMLKGVDSGKVTPSQFRAWAAFSDKFELTWDSTAAGWLRARDAKEKVEQGRIEAAIAGIGAELLGFYLKVRDLGLLPNLVPAGAP